MASPLSDLPDALLATILSFLPTHIAARTSALCHRFRYLWEASPSLALISPDLPQPQTDNFIAMANRALLQSLSHIHGEVPLLRKAVFNLHDIHERDVNAVAGLLNWISHVEELSLQYKGEPVDHLCSNLKVVCYDMSDMNLILDVKYPIPILLESGKDVPKFSNLKHLDATLCFHEHNLAAFIMTLHNCPVLKSLKLVHENRKRKDWGSKLLRNADGNYRYAYFRDLHLEEDRKEFLSKKCTSKRQASK